MKVRGPIETPIITVPGWTIYYTPKWGVSARARTSRAGDYPPSWKTVINRRSMLGSHWTTVLTGSQRNDWSSYAATHPVPKESGRIITLTGYQFFIRQNLLRVRIGQPITNTPPTASIPAPPGVLDATVNASNVYSITFDNSNPWTRNIFARCIVALRGPANIGNRTSRQMTAQAAVIIGIPIIGHILPVPILPPWLPPNQPSRHGFARVYDVRAAIPATAKHLFLIRQI